MKNTGSSPACDRIGPILRLILNDISHTIKTYPKAKLNMYLGKTKLLIISNYTRCYHSRSFVSPVVSQIQVYIKSSEQQSFHNYRVICRTHTNLIGLFQNVRAKLNRKYIKFQLTRLLIHYGVKYKLSIVKVANIKFIAEIVSTRMAIQL